MTALRSFLFIIAGVLVTPFYGVAVTVLGPFSFHAAFAAAAQWTRVILWLAKVCCGIRHEVSGLEHVPDFPVVIMAKHQSAWETLFMEANLPPQCWIIKRELLWLPFVGWGLWGVKSIAIDRSSGHSAREQIVEIGARRLAEGICVSIFPEGTRVAVGKRGRYGIGGAALATRTGTPILPIAHNAGEFWGRNAFRKHAGTVQVVIGPLIATEGRNPVSVNRELEAWIEGQMQRLNPERYGAV
jgi:1-acyl-sn-glycerol-3-phosphate acyltransferase